MSTTKEQYEKKAKELEAGGEHVYMSPRYKWVFKFKNNGQCPATWTEFNKVYQNGKRPDGLPGWARFCERMTFQEFLAIGEGPCDTQDVGS